jgi:hypothetical protein
LKVKAVWHDIDGQHVWKQELPEKKVELAILCQVEAMKAFEDRLLTSCWHCC